MQAQNYISKVVRDINKNFVIRYFYNEDPRQTFLKGGGKYAQLVGEDLADKHFEKALNGGQQKYIFKLRRGLTVTFTAK